MADHPLLSLPDHRLILASESRARRRMFDGARIAYDAKAPNVDEEALRQAADHEGLTHADTATMLAEAKAMKISASHPDAVVIASDQLLVCDGEVYGKPTHRDEARHRLETLSDKTHELVTAGVMMTNAGQRLWHLVKIPRITFRRLDADQIDAYLDAMADDAYQTPGVYMIEGLGAQLIKQMEGCYYTIMGFPMLECLGHLQQMGLRFEKAKS